MTAGKKKRAKRYSFFFGKKKRKMPRQQWWTPETSGCDTEDAPVTSALAAMYEARSAMLYPHYVQQTWAQWATATNTNSASTLTLATYDVNPVWSRWTSAGTTATNVNLWPSWVTQFADAVLARRERDWPRQAYQTPAPRVVTEEDLARNRRWELQREAQLEEQRVARAARAAAEAKAEELLRANLSEAQRQELEQHDWFLVIGKTGEIFRIRRGRSANVDVIDPKTGAIVKRLCAHPNVHCPDADTMLAQKLHLEDDAQSFIRVANDHGRPYGGEGAIILPPRLRLVA